MLRHSAANTLSFKERAGVRMGFLSIPQDPSPPNLRHDDPHPYPSPLEGEGQRERGLHDWEELLTFSPLKGEIERGMGQKVLCKLSRSCSVPMVPEKYNGILR
jgi:hypothetical protein